MSSDSNRTEQRTRLNFPHAVAENFAFLSNFGLSTSEVSPTIVRFAQGNLECNVYHGRQSFEIGFELGRDGDLYSMSELIRATAPEVAGQYRNFIATTPSSVTAGVLQLADLVKRFTEPALRGDATFLAVLANQRKSWSEAYALEVLAEQLRPKADAAFHRGAYREAAELYEKILPSLSAAELKKLELARKRG